VNNSTNPKNIPFTPYLSSNFSFTAFLLALGDRSLLSHIRDVFVQPTALTHPHDSIENRQPAHPPSIKEGWQEIHSKKDRSTSWERDEGVTKKRKKTFSSHPINFLSSAHAGDGSGNVGAHQKAANHAQLTWQLTAHPGRRRRGRGVARANQRSGIIRATCVQAHCRASRCDYLRCPDLGQSASVCPLQLA
jgi:hypothetical protein